MDLYNNAIGIMVFNENPYATDADLANLILGELKAGSLRYLSPLGDYNALIDDTQLVNTNQNCL